MPPSHPPLPPGSNPPEPMRINPLGPSSVPSKIVGMTGKPIRMPTHVQLAQAGVPHDFVEKLKEAAQSGNGYMVALWKLDGPLDENKPLPSFRVLRTCVRYPTAMLLESVKLLLQNIVEDQMGGAVGGTQAAPPSPNGEGNEPEKK